MKRYPTDLTNSQWQIIKSSFNWQRKRRHSLRRVLDAVLYLVKTGCQWRQLPLDFPAWQLVYYYFRRWKRSGLVDRLQRRLVRLLRRRSGRTPQPSVGIIDAQSIKSTLVSSRAHTGYDGGKKIKGIKRHLVVDTLGLLLCVVVHAASVADRKGGGWVLEKLKHRWRRVEKIFADGGYPLPGKAAEPDQRLAGYDLQIVRRSEQHRFEVLPKRWIVERSFAWLDTNRRNTKSFERLPDSAEAITQIAATRMMLNHF